MKPEQEDYSDGDTVKVDAMVNVHEFAKEIIQKYNNGGDLNPYIKSELNDRKKKGWENRRVYIGDIIKKEVDKEELEKVEQWLKKQLDSEEQSGLEEQLDSEEQGGGRGGQCGRGKKYRRSKKKHSHKISKRRRKKSKRVKKSMRKKKTRRR